MVFQFPLPRQNYQHDFCGRIFAVGDDRKTLIARLTMTNQQDPTYLDTILQNLTGLDLDFSHAQDGESREPQRRELTVLERDRVCELISRIVHAAINRSPMTEIHLLAEDIRILIWVKDALEPYPEDKRR